MIHKCKSSIKIRIIFTNKWFILVAVSYTHLDVYKRQACIFATTLSDHETAAEKCEEDEEGFDGCSEYLYSTC